MNTLRNGLILTEDGLVTGGLVIEGEQIADAGRVMRADGSSIDLDGDLLIAGLVDPHVNFLPSLASPRRRSAWPRTNSFAAYDACVIAAGITTSLDTFMIETQPDGRDLAEDAMHWMDALLRLRRADLLKAEHFAHLRCEILDDDAIPAVERLLKRHSHQVRAISVMEHVPGIRQFRDREAWEESYRALNGFDADGTKRLLAMRERNRHRRDALIAEIVALTKFYNVAIFSHDDETAEDIAEAVAYGAVVAEFPVTREAALCAVGSGLPVLIGAPNVVMGGSHVGNVAASTIVADGAASILSSDYVPHASLEAIWLLSPDRPPSVGIAAMAAARPARVLGFEDRGVLRAGHRADFLRVRVADGHPFVREAWIKGQRAA